jgi:hypothetical protein
MTQGVRGRGRPRRNQQSSPASTTTNLVNQQALTQPEETAFDSQLEQTVLQIQSEYRPDSTSTIYDAKSQEYFAYCTSLYPTNPYAKVLSQYKVYRFVFYQCFRDQKK